MSGAGRQARRTEYKGTMMRSRLEAGFAAWLDRYHVAWEYEPQAFANEDGQYLPDFRLEDVYVAGAGTFRAYVEIKPENWHDIDGQLARSMRIIYESDTTAMLVLQRAGAAPMALVGGEGTWAPLEWIFLGTDPRTVGLAFPVFGAARPWAGEYWKATA